MGVGGGAPQVSLQGLTSVLLDISDVATPKVAAATAYTDAVPGPHPVPSGTEWHLFLSRRTGDYPAWDSKATTCRIVSHRTTTGLEWPPIPARLRRTSGCAMRKPRRPPEAGVPPAV